MTARHASTAFSRRRFGNPAPAPLLPDFEGHGATAVETRAGDVFRGQLEDIASEIRTLNESIPENRTLTAEESAKFDEIMARRAKVQQRLEAAEVEEQRAARAAAAQAGVAGTGDSDGRFVVTREAKTYDEPLESYFLDLARVQLNRGDARGGIEGAKSRLARHAKELEVDMPRRSAAFDEAAERQAEVLQSEQRRAFRAMGRNMFEKRVNPNRTDGQGGYFVPPTWLMDEYVDLPRFGRTAANLCRQLALPSGTDSINVPKIATGTTVAVQTADAGAVSSTDMTDTSVNAPVRTLAGQQDFALQLLDQSPVSFDEIIFADLIADYNMKLDQQVIYGTGSAGQVLGILNAGGTAVTYTDATPTLPELWVPLLQSASRVAKLRKLPATGVLMDPAVWYWALSQLDTTSRPLLMGNALPGNYSASTMGLGGDLAADGPAGVFTYGLPAFLDGNIPSNLGAGTNESRIITARWSDFYLWEGEMRTRVLPEILSNTMQVRLQIYNYVAFMANRRPEAAAIISGTGMIPAAGF